MTAEERRAEYPIRIAASSRHLLPTPTVNGNYNRAGLSPTSGDGLATVAKRLGNWPTPRAIDAHSPWRGGKTDGLNVVVQFPTPNVDSMCGCSGSYAQIKNNPNLTEEEKRSMASGNAGRLNPDWVEWLMCWPVGWTDIETPNHRLSWRHPGRDPADLPPDDPAYVPRLTMRRDNHAKRVRAIGNGQFPATAHVAFRWGLAVLEAVRAGG